MNVETAYISQFVYFQFNLFLLMDSSEVIVFEGLSFSQLIVCVTAGSTVLVYLNTL